jgi:hypothetical protein
MLAGRRVHLQPKLESMNSSRAKRVEITISSHSSRRVRRMGKKGWRGPRRVGGRGATMAEGVGRTEGGARMGGEGVVEVEEVGVGGGVARGVGEEGVESRPEW